MKPIFLTLVATVLLALGASVGWSAPNPCTGPYDPVLVAVDPAWYAAFDLNGNQRVCVATNKRAKPQIKDDQIPKK